MRWTTSSLSSPCFYTVWEIHVSHQVESRTQSRRMRWLKTTCIHKSPGIPPSALALPRFSVQESRGICCPKLSLAHQEVSVTPCLSYTPWICVWNATGTSGRNKSERHVQWTWMRSCWRSSLPTNVIYKLTKFFSSHLITFCSSNTMIIVNPIATMSVGS